MTINGTRQNPGHGSRAASISASAMALFIFGIIMLCGCGIHKAAVSVRSQIGFVAVVDPSYGAASLDSLKQALSTAPYIQTITGSTASEVLQRWESLMGPEELLDINPFLPEFDITVKPDWAKADSLEAIALSLESLNCVDHVQVHAETASAIGRNTASFFLLLSLAAACIAVCCMALTANAVISRLRSLHGLLADSLVSGQRPASIAGKLTLRTCVNSIIAGLLATAALAALWGYAGFLDSKVFNFISWTHLAAAGAVIIVAGVAVSSATAFIWVNFKANRIPDDND